MVASRTLLLNSTYEPVKVISWQRAVTMLVLGKVETIRTYDSVLRAVHIHMPTPAVVRLVDFVRRRRTKSMRRTTAGVWMLMCTARRTES